LRVEFNQSTPIFPAALETAEFFSGTTEETTTLRTFCLVRNRPNRLLETLSVAIRTGLEMRVADAKANFVYELLMSTNK